MTTSIKFGDIEIDTTLYDFVIREVLPETGIDESSFWNGFAKLLANFCPRNAVLLAKRDELQRLIDAWHQRNPGAAFDTKAYRAYLIEIGYLVPEQDAFAVSTENVDAEIALIAGPQLVVPVNNARYALNAANARWGSLYDALYGTDALPQNGVAPGGAYDPIRGKEVIDFTRKFLDEAFPLAAGSHLDAATYSIANRGLEVHLKTGAITTLVYPDAFAGFRGSVAAPSLVLLRHHGLHVELHVDRQHFIGRNDPAGISDVVLESAVTTIQDCEDSVAAVSAKDKVVVYRNWLGLMKGTLQAKLQKGSNTLQRRLNDDRRYQTLSGGEVVLPGRSVMLVRNVGHHMLTDVIKLQGKPIPETLMDAVITSLAAMHDLNKSDSPRNSRTRSVYIVKPKMHGPEEVAFASDLFTAVEDLLVLPRYTLKIGIMDEERRTTVNLLECIRAVKDRVVFINTGFLDRTGDEIHTSMEAAAVPRKSELKKAIWLDAYERQNVDIGIACGMRGRAQIGKGMWAMPDLMADMLKNKIAHPLAGANTAWVPSPTAATLHALHYHKVDVAAVQSQLAARPRASLDEILTPPLAAYPNWSAPEIEEELNNNAQSILGYVVRWIDSGVGCSKVPDYFNVALMEDRATLRISSQHVANWMRHGICSHDQVMSALRRMVKVVDEQNGADPLYRPMATNTEHNVAFQAACDLIFKGREQPNGYTEAILTARRKEQME